MSDTAQVETHSFQAEVQQVLHLVIHSLYSNKDIFLRELISNGSDACDKLRFETLKQPELSAEDAELRLEISVDKEARTLTLRDNGIGMGREEVVENIGTIARSGTRRFLENLTGDQRRDAQLIGQFGVGFYSAFVVADRVVLETRRAGAPAAEGVRWSSAGTGEYTLETVADLARGTRVILHLKEGEDEFLDDWRLRELIRRYSDHIAFPILLERPEAKDDEPRWETANQASALWTRPKTDLSDEDYQNFYRHVAHDFNGAAAWTHNRVEGSQSYTVLLFLPEKAPFDLAMTGRDERKGLKLYVRRVFIMDAAEQLLPSYLRFLRGVVDSDDLPLNVSREILQQNALMSRIRSGLVKRGLDLLDRLASEEGDKYQNFWGLFGNVLKEGLVEDASNRERIAKLLRFASTAPEGAQQRVSLDDYISRMKAEQEEIFYLTADSEAAARHSPHLEALRQRGVEVLLLFDRIDEWAIGGLHEYQSKRLRSVAKGDLDLDKLGPAPEGQPDAAESAPDAVLERVKGLLGDRVSAVRASRRLAESPSCLVLDEHAMALHMQRLLKQAGHDLPSDKPALELNLSHALVRRLDQEADADRAGDLAHLLFEQAVIAEGGQLEDPAAFVQRVNRVLLA